MGVVHEAIQDRIAKRGVADVFVPVLNRELTGHQRGATSRTIFDEF